MNRYANRDPYHFDIDLVLISHANFSTETIHKRNWSVVLLSSWKPWFRAQVIPGPYINLTSNLLIEMLLYPSSSIPPYNNNST